jgi:Tol biopolymer transport system component
VFPNTGLDILTVRIDGDGRPKPLLNSIGPEGASTISPNGRWIAYRSNETGASRIHVRPYPEVSRSRRVVSDGPGDDPLWGPDGHELLYVTPEGVMVAPIVETGETVQRGTPRRLFSVDAYHRGNNYNWDISRDGKRFLMVKRGPVTEQTQITVVQNWDQELKRLVPTR